MVIVIEMGKLKVNLKFKKVLHGGPFLASLVPGITQIARKFTHNSIKS